MWYMQLTSHFNKEKQKVEQELDNRIMVGERLFGRRKACVETTKAIEIMNMIKQHKSTLLPSYYYMYTI